MTVKGKIKIFCLFLSLIILFLLKGQASAQPNEHLIKAIYFEKFSRFTQWPPQCNISDATTPFQITIYGENLFEGLIENIYDTQKIAGKTVNITFVENIDDIENPHVLFIGKVSEKKLEKVLAKTENKPILTVSEHAGFAQKGVLINFYLVDNKIRFEINESAVKKSGLEIDFRLLSFAKIINPLKNN